jgi:hypothetical protein
MCDHTRLTNSTTPEHRLGWATACPDNATDSCRRRTIRTSMEEPAKSFLQEEPTPTCTGWAPAQEPVQPHAYNLGQLGPSCRRRATTYLTAHFATDPTSSIEPPDRWPLGWCLSTNHHPTSVSGTRRARGQKNKNKCSRANAATRNTCTASRGWKVTLPSALTANAATRKIQLRQLLKRRQRLASLHCKPPPAAQSAVVPVHMDLRGDVSDNWHAR